MRFRLLLSLVWTALAGAQTLSVSGSPQSNKTFTPEEFARLPHTMITVNEHGKSVEFEGVLLRDLLKLTDAPLGVHLKGENMPAFLYLSAKDGYHVTLALAEAEPDFQNNQILVADSADRKPLPDGQGPFRLIVPEDKKPARWIRMLQKIEVRMPEAKPE